MTLPLFPFSTLMRPTDIAMLPNSRRKFDRFDSSLFIQFKPLENVASFFLGLTKNMSCEGFNFTFQNVSLEPGQRVQFKLKHPRSNLMISFHGDVIWQERKKINYSAGIKFCDFSKKNKQILLKIISDSCSIPVNSLFKSNDTGKLLSNEFISRIPNRYRRNHRRLYRSLLILVITAAVLLLPAVIDNFENGSTTSISRFIKSIAIDNINRMKNVFKNENSQLQNSDMQTTINSIQLQPAENSNSIESIEENIPSVIQEEEPDIKIPVHIKEVPGENKFYLQIGSYKDPYIAQGMLSKLKQEYPEAYLFPQSNFYKLRIPDIKTSEQGYHVIKNIEMKFNIKPILVERVQ